MVTARFRSAVDMWFYLVVLGSMLTVMLALGPILATPTGGRVLLASGMFLVAVALPLWLLMGTYYTVVADELRIRSGPFRWVIALSDIEHVRPSRSLISSPALSLNRLEIAYAGGKRILISPRNPERFLEVIGHGTGAG